MRDASLPKHPLIGVHWAALLTIFLVFLTMVATLMGWAMGHNVVVAILYKPSLSWLMAGLLCLSCWTILVGITDSDPTPHIKEDSTAKALLFDYIFSAWLMVFLVTMGPVVYLLGLDWKDQKSRARSLMAFTSTLFLLSIPLVPGPQGWVNPLAAGLAWGTGLLQ